MPGRPQRDESSSPPAARDLLLASLLFGAAAMATVLVLRAMFGGRPYIGPRRMYIGPLLEFVALLCLLPGLLSAGLGIAVSTGRRRLDHRAAAAARLLGSVGTSTAWAADGILRWIETRIPPATPQSLGLFRIVFGAALLGYFLTHPVGADMVPLAIPESAAHRAVLPIFAACPAAVDWIRPWLLVWTLLFMAGAFARVSFGMLTAGAVAWALVWSMRVGAHSMQVLIVALLCLLPSRWGDAWSADSLVRRARQSLGSNGRRHPPAAPSSVYGYPMWMLGLILATSYAAAAFAKLREGGLAWITNGTVRYHFLTDSEQALVDWGTRLAQSDVLAVLLSLGAVVIEALVIVGVLSTRYRHRLAAGLAAMALLVGFRLFQGLLWPAWWMLLLAFLPWHRLPPGAATAQAMPSRRDLAPYTAVVLILVGQQVVASLATIEHAPFVSAFDMYSTTYAGPVDYEQKSGATYWIVGALADGTSERCRVTKEEADAVAARTSDPRPILVKCFQSKMGSVLGVSVESQRRAIDWVRWRLGDEVRTPIAGPIVLR